MRKIVLTAVLIGFPASLWAQAATPAPVPDGGAAETPAPAQDIATLLGEAQGLIQQRQFEKALPKLNSALKLDPNSVLCNLAKAEALLGLSDGRGALTYAKMATTLAPENGRGWQLAGEAYLLDSNQDYPRAEEAFRQGMAAVPGSLDLRLGLARALSYQRKVEEAVLELKKALEVFPDDLTVMTKLAESYFVLRKLDQADELLERVLARDPGNADAKRIREGVEGRRSYNFWVIALAAILIPAFYFGVRWLKKGRVPKV
jgi:tetratricopeptide (TPR) repeat protein